MARLIFIGGTDTAVGKTLTACALSQYFFKQKLNTKYLKPFQTGNRSDWDGRILEKHGAVSSVNYFWTHEHPGAPYECTSFFQAPSIHWDSLLTWTRQECLELKATEQVVLIEGCGGICVPITSQYTLLDWVRAFPPIEIILVSHLRLGTLNHTAQSILALKSLPNPLLGLIYFGEGNVRNITMIETLYQVPTLGRVHWENQTVWFEGHL